MEYSPTELEALVRQRAPEIARDIQAAARRSRIEADLVAEVEDVLKRFEKSFDLSLRLERERTLVNGRADAVYNRLVIEYEPPGSLRKDPTARTNQHAIDQVKQYMHGLARMDRHRKERLAGVVLDGSFFIFIRFRDGHWHIEEPVPVSAHSTENFLRYLLSLSTELALTPDNLMRDFGENTVVSRMAVPALYNALCTSPTPKVRVLFQQWQHLFSEICGYEEGSSKLDVAALAKTYGVLPCRATGDALVRPLALFFSIHTYYAAFIKLLAVQVAHYYLMPKLGIGLAQVASADTEQLRTYLHKMERGGVFADFGIKNFLEGDFFGWYLDAWDERVENALRRMIGHLANYSLVTLDVDPEETRDLLKQLYQNLMPKKLRHDLGEYYTPDWLAERLLNQLGVDGNPGKRLLDPACGSGTFLVLTLKRVREYADEKMLPPAGVLEQVLQNVVGYDLNPLAVMTARTNYLLALGDLLEYRQGEISIPVYLADSIMTPSMETGEGGQLSFLDQGPDSRVREPAYTFNTAVGRFSVPRSLVDARYIDELASLLEECVGVGLQPEQFQARLMRTFPLDADRDAAEVRVAMRLYEQLLELDCRGINGIWARIIKNAFAPLFQGRFDYVAGNPPWVNWESLPDEYRQDTAALWQHYRMAASRGQRSEQFELGKQKRDISTLMTYVCLDNYVEEHGRLGFVITQSVFKTGGSEGFRRFQLPDSTPLGVLHVDDMARLRPFQGASNRTAIVIFARGRETRYPVQYALWYKPTGGAAMPEHITLREITATKLATYRRLVARPVDKVDPSSPWLVGRERAINTADRISGSTDYQGRAGVCTWFNSIYWVEIIAPRRDGHVVVGNLSEGAKRKADTVQAAIEQDLLHPLVRARDIDRWRAAPSAHILVPHTPDTAWQAIPEEVMQVRYPRTYAYLNGFRDLLLSRSGYRLLRPGHPFYILGNIHQESFGLYKVVWRGEVAPTLTAAVISEYSGACVIPDQTAYFVALSSETEAHYLCSLLNSLPVQVHYKMRDYKHVPIRFLQQLAIPRYEPTDRLHARLAVISELAHNATAEGDASQVRELEAEIDHLAAQVWGLTDAELRDMQQSLAELG